MTQLGMAVAALNHDSSFQAAYEKGMKKSEYWTHTLEDCINLIARLPALAARIYRNVYKPGAELPAINKDLDLVGKWAPRYDTRFMSTNITQEIIPICSVTATTTVWQSICDFTLHYMEIMKEAMPLPTLLVS